MQRIKFSRSQTSKRPGEAKQKNAANQQKMACSGAFGTPGWVRTSGLSLRRRPLYPTELRGLIQKIFNFQVQPDSNELPLRRRTLYPGEVRGHIQKLFNFTRLQDSNDSIFRRRSLYTTELRGYVGIRPMLWCRRMGTVSFYPVPGGLSTVEIDRSGPGGVSAARPEVRFPPASENAGSGHGHGVTCTALRFRRR